MNANTNVIRVSPQINERLERLRVDRRLESTEQLLEEIISLADSIYAGAKAGYTDVVLRESGAHKPNGTPREKLLVRNYLRK